MNDLARWCRDLFGLPVLLAAALLSIASLHPLHLDQRNFQDLRRAAALELPAGVPYLFVSTGRDPAAYRFAGYVLHMLAYPSPEKCWLVLTPSSETEGPERRSGANDASCDPLRYSDRGVVLYDSTAARAAAEAAYPRLRSARQAHVLAQPPPATFPWRRPANLLTFDRVLRLAALLGLVMAMAQLFRRAWGTNPPNGSAALSLALGVVVASATSVWACSWSQVLPLGAPGPWPYLAWVCAAGLLWRQRATPPIAPMQRPRLALALAAIGVGVVYVGLFFLRLDFDEDTHAHWMLMTRSYYALGRHVPEQLLGHIHAATYPFGFAAFLSLSAWLADLPRERLFGLDDATSLALLLYRGWVALLCLSFVAIVAAVLKLLTPTSRQWLVALAVLPLLLPTLQGRHIGAETLLVPLMGTALACLLAGRWTARPWLTWLGLWLGGTATLLKLEAGLIFALVVLPWMVGAGGAVAWRGRRAAASLASLVAGLLPTILWRAQLDVENSIYLWPTPATILARADLIGPVLQRCLLFIVKADLTLLFFAALPAAVLYRMTRGGGLASRWQAVAVPLSIAITCAGMAAIYVFSKLPWAWQIDASYGRLLYLPTFSAVLYCFEANSPVSPGPVTTQPS